MRSIGVVTFIQRQTGNPKQTRRGRGKKIRPGEYGLRQRNKYIGRVSSDWRPYGRTTGEGDVGARTGTCYECD